MTTFLSLPHNVVLQGNARQCVLIFKKKSGDFMYTLKDRTKELASEVLGIAYDDFIDMDCPDEFKYIQKITEQRLTFVAEEDMRIIGRGNLLLAREEFLTMDEVDKEM